MKMGWSKMWHRKENYLEVGLSLNDWALPLHVAFNRPYTTIPSPTQPERWKTEVMVTLLCFYLRFEWVSGPDLVSRMVETLEKE